MAPTESLIPHNVHIGANMATVASSLVICVQDYFEDPLNYQAYVGAM